MMLLEREKKSYDNAQYMARKGRGGNKKSLEPVDCGVNGIYNYC